MKGYRTAVVGATGAVGAEMLAVLERRGFPVSELVPLASSAEGRTVRWKGVEVPVGVARAAAFERVDIALFSAGADVSLELAPLAVKAGAVVVDNSSAWRMDPAVPLVVPEVNPDALEAHRGIVANPNCSTIQMVVALKPLHDAFRVRRVVVSTYQAVSGTGAPAMAELAAQARAWVADEEPVVAVYPRRILWNVLPHIDDFLPDGYTKEEAKMVNETRKILDPGIAVCPTAVRVPVFRGHSESVAIETRLPCPVAEARALLAKAPGVRVVDEPAALAYPTALDADGRDEVLVGRLRADPTVPHGLCLWIVSDNLLKGAALNAVQIAELLVERGLAGWD